MIVVLTTSRGPVGIEPEAVRAVVPNKTDSACTVIFSETHSIEVIGPLAKIRTKLNGAAIPAPVEDTPVRAPAAAIRPRSSIGR